MFDNQGAIALVKNPTHYFHTKHIDIQYCFICEKIGSNVIEMKYIPMEHVVVDVLTKDVECTRKMALKATMNKGFILSGLKKYIE